MSRLYAVSFGGQSTSTAQDMFGVYSGPNIALRLREFRIIADNGTSGDSIPITISRLSGTITRGSGGNTVAPIPLRSTDAAASFVSRTNDTTQASATSYEFVFASGANVVEGWTYQPAIDCCVVIQQGEACIIGGQGPMGVVFSAYAVFEELS